MASGCIRNTSGELPDRLKLIVRDLATVIGAHLPTEVAVEKVFVNVNPQSTLLLGQARGAAISAAVLAELPVSEYTALQIKARKEAIPTPVYGMAEVHHVNSNKPSEEYLIPLKLTWASTGALEAGEVVYPKPSLEKQTYPAH